MRYSRDPEVLAVNPSAEVDLFQWDIVNATTFKGINQSIAIQDKSPKTIKTTAVAPNIPVIDADWGIWQVTTGGTGGELMMDLPLVSGTSSVEVKRPDFAVLQPPVTNPGKESEVSLGVDKLSIIGSNLGTDTAHAFSTKTFTSGKVYFEVTVVALGTSVVIGLAPLDAPLSRFMDDSKSIAYRSNGRVYTGGALTGIKNSQGNTVDAERWLSVDATVGMAIDFDDKKVWIRGADGAWQGEGADPVSGTGQLATLDLTKDLYPLVAVRSNAKALINLGQRPFKHPVPTGFAPGVKVSDIRTVHTDLKDANVTARVTLKKMNNGANTKDLLVNDKASATTQAVEVIESKTGGGVNGSQMLNDVFEAWLNKNIVNFDNIFHAIDYSALASKGGQVPDTMKWIAPKFTSYAVQDIPAADPPVQGAPEAVFAVLNQVEASTVDKSKLAEQVSADLLAHIQGDENAVVAISAEQLTKEILLNGANATAGENENPKFKIGDDSRVVTNDAEYKLPLTKLLLSKEAVQPTVPKGGFEMRIEGRRIKVNYTGLHFQTKDAQLNQDETVTFDLEQTMFLELKENKKGEHILWPTFTDPLNPKDKEDNMISNWNVTMKLDDVDNTGLWIGLICAGVGVLLLGVGCAAGVYFCRAGSDAAVVADGIGTELQDNPGVAAYGQIPEFANGGAGYAPFPEASYDAAEHIYDDPGSRLSMAEMDGVPVVDDTASQAALGATKALPHGSILHLAHLGIGFHTLRAMGNKKTVKDLNLSTQDLQAIANNDVDKTAIGATVQKFLETALSPFDWPETTGFDLTSAHLQGPLLLQGKLKSRSVKTSSISLFRGGESS